MSSNSSSRRTFLKSALVAGTGFTIIPRHVLGNGFVAPSDQLTKAIIGVGGIDSGETALKKLEAGADLVQIYTGFIYKGPGLVEEILSAIRQK